MLKVNCEFSTETVNLDDFSEIIEIYCLSRNGEVRLNRWSCPVRKLFFMFILASVADNNTIGEIIFAGALLRRVKIVFCCADHSKIGNC